MRLRAILAAAAAAAFLTACGNTASTHTVFGSGDDRAVISSVHCGVERWAVKTGTDAGASSVDLAKVTDTTVEALGQLAVPSSLTRDSGRIGPVETTVYRVQATLTGFKMESDSDYHLILSDGQGNTMIAEIPDPACVGQNSPFLPDIAAARAAFDAQYTASGSFQNVSVPVTVTGAGFFDFPHGQSGVAPNAIELHPVLNIEFGADAAPTAAP